MGVYIPNMEKPKNCAECFRILKCKSVPRWVTADDSIPKSCPLIDIVTCGECKWGDTGIDEEGKLFWKCLGIHYGGTKPTDFCSYGERRSDGDINGCEYEYAMLESPYEGENKEDLKRQVDLFLKRTTAERRSE